MRRKFSSEEKMAIVLGGMKDGANVSELCRSHGISQTLYYRWRDSFLEGGKAALNPQVGKQEQGRLKAQIEQLEKTLGRKALEIEILKKALGG